MSMSGYTQMFEGPKIMLFLTDGNPNMLRMSFLRKNQICDCSRVTQMPLTDHTSEINALLFLNYSLYTICPRSGDPFYIVTYCCCCLPL